MKAWFSKYFNLVFAAYLAACAGYFVAAIAWVVVWNSERIYTRSVTEIRQSYALSIEKIRQEYIESIERIRGDRDAT